MEKQKILITGLSGFVGRNVKEYLEAKHQYELYSPLSRELDWRNASIPVNHWKIICGFFLNFRNVRICMERCFILVPVQSMINVTT